MEVPQKLAALRQWILWRLEGEAKIPYQPNGRKAKSNDPTTWNDLATCKAAAERFTGLGFVFAADDGLFGIDLDGCRNKETGEIAEWAKTVIDSIQTYAEVSPSGTGVKLYGAGVLPWTGKRKINSPVTGKQPAIEAYSSGRYFAFTGECLDGWYSEVYDCDPTAALKPYFAAEPAKPAAQPTATGHDVTARAAKYLAKMPPAVSGQGGHNQTFRAACVLVLGFDLPIDVAFPLLAEWNLACNPPWADKDIWHKLADAAKREGNRGWLLTGRQYEGPDIDLRALLSDVAAEPAPRLFKPSPEFPAECLRVDGLIGEVMDFNLRTARYPQPELALAGALALMATITGRKITDAAGTRTNIYVLGLAPSGAGKEHARKINKELLMRAGGDQHIGPERIASHSGLVSSVHSQPCTLFQIDEIGHMLATMKNSAGKSPHLYNIGSVLMQLYSSSDTIWKADAYADQKKNKTINQPHCVIHGTGVPDGFWDNLTSENVRDGLLGRMLTFESRLGYVPMAKADREPLPEPLIERVREWLQFAPSGNLQDQHPVPAVAEYEPAARERLDDHLTAICERRMAEDSTQAAVWSRSGEKTSKLALLFACSRGTPGGVLVTLSDVNRAIRIANFLTRQMLGKAEAHVSENETESRLKRVLRLIEGKMTMSELTRKTQWLKGKERQELLADLVHSGFVEIETKDSTGGRKAITIWRVGERNS